MFQKTSMKKSSFNSNFMLPFSCTNIFCRDLNEMKINLQCDLFSHHSVALTYDSLQSICATSQNFVKFHKSVTL